MHLAMGARWLSLTNMALRAVGLVARFGLTLYLARYLTLPDFGLFGLIVGAISAIPASAGWGINYFLNRDVVGRPKLESGRMIRDRLAVTLASLLLLSLIAFPVLIKWHLMPSIGLILLTISLAIMESLAFDIYQVLISIGHPLAANVLLFIRSAAWVFPVAALGIMVPEFRTLQTVLTAWLMGSVLSFISIMWVLRAWPLQDIWRSKVHIAETLQIIRKARFVYVSDVAIAVMPFLDRYVVAHFLGLTMSGVFTLYWSVANAAYMLVSSGVIQLSYPSLVKEFRDGNIVRAKELINQLRLNIFVFAGILCLSAGTGLPYVLSWLGKAALNGHELLLWMLLLALCVRLLSDSLSMELSCRRLDRHWAALNIAGCFITLAFSILCIKSFGLAGAALSGILSQLLLAALRFGAIARATRNQSVIVA